MAFTSINQAYLNFVETYLTIRDIVNGCCNFNVSSAQEENTYMHSTGLDATSNKLSFEVIDSESQIYDLSKLFEINKNDSNYPMIGTLNINSLRYKIIDLRQILSCAPLEVLAVNDTKFPDSQFVIDNYYNPCRFRKDRNEYGGGGILVFVKKGCPAIRLRSLEKKLSLSSLK